MAGSAHLRSSGESAKRHFAGPSSPLVRIPLLGNIQQQIVPDLHLRPRQTDDLHLRPRQTDDMRTREWGLQLQPAMQPSSNTGARHGSWFQLG
jgi:hypothetical protein